jgi:glycosyltransferase involved in cell wall biosynthesis
MITVPSYIDTELFKDRKIKRMADSVIALGELGEHKGIYNVMKYAEKNTTKRIDFYCFNAKDEFKYLDNMRFLPAIKYELLPIYFNMYESFIHLPEWKEPFGRTVAEAKLSGCKLITNDNIGFLSYKLNDDLRVFLESGPTIFWEAVKRATNNIL